MASAEVAPVGSDGRIAGYSSVAPAVADSGVDDAVAGEPMARPAALHFDEELRLADVRKESLAPEDLVYEGLGLFEAREPEADADDALSTEPLAPQIVFRTAAAQLPVLALPNPSRGIAFQLWPSALALCRYIEQLAAGARSPFAAAAAAARAQSLRMHPQVPNGPLRSASSSWALGWAP